MSSFNLTIQEQGCFRNARELRSYAIHGWVYMYMNVDVCHIVEISPSKITWQVNTAVNCPFLFWKWFPDKKLF